MWKYVMGFPKKKKKKEEAESFNMNKTNVFFYSTSVDLKKIKSIGQKQAFSMESLSWKQLNQGRLVSSWKKSSNRKHKAYWLLTEGNNSKSTTALIFFFIIIWH